MLRLSLRAAALSSLAVLRGKFGVNRSRRTVLAFRAIWLGLQSVGFPLFKNLLSQTQHIRVCFLNREPSLCRQMQSKGILERARASAVSHSVHQALIDA